MGITVIFFDLGDTLVTHDRQWIAGAKPLLASLRQAGFRLGILSNTPGLKSRAEILKLMPADFKQAPFEPQLTLFSSEVGLEKPQRAIFMEAVKRSGRPAGECLYCSENIVETMMAQEAGMRSICVLSLPKNDLTQLAETVQQFQKVQAQAHPVAV